MIVELFYSPGCARCAASQAELKAVALETIEGLTWREVNVLDELDYAVELGVLTPPAVAIDRELVFASLPTPTQLRRALLRQVGQGG
jgi:thioredoxin